MKSVERSKFLTSLQSALDKAGITIKTPSLTEKFCLCLGKVKVTPKFTYTQVEKVRTEQLLIIFAGNEEASDHQFLCEMWVKKFYLGLGTGRSKAAARNFAVQQVVGMLGPRVGLSCQGPWGLEYTTLRVMESALGMDSVNSNISMKMKNMNNVDNKKMTKLQNCMKKMEITSKKIKIIDINNNSDDDMGGAENKKFCCKGFEVKGKVTSSSEKKKVVVQKPAKHTMLHYGPKMTKVEKKEKTDLILKSVAGVKAVARLKACAELSEVAIELFVEKIANPKVSTLDHICTVFVDGEAIADAVGKAKDCKDEAAKLALQYLSSVHTTVKVFSNILNKEAVLSKAQFKAKAGLLLTEEIISPANAGFQMLLMLGWSKGEGLGKDGLGRLEPVEANGMKVFGQKPVEIGSITEREAEIVIKQYVIEESVDDLTISMRDVTAEEVAVIEKTVKKFSLTVKSVARRNDENGSYLILIKGVVLSDIVKILKTGRKSMLYQGTSKHMLVDRVPCKQEVLTNQHIRETKGYPEKLVKLNKDMKVKKQDQAKHLQPKYYQQVAHAYPGTEVTSAGEGYNWKVFVTYVEYFDNLYISLVDDDMSASYQEMEHQLNTWAQASYLTNTRTEVVVDRLYAAKFGEKWCRARLVEDMADSLVTCHLIDQGDYHMVHMDNLMDLPRQFTSLTAQALAVSLHGMTNITWQEWSAETANIMEDILQNHQLEAKVTNMKCLDKAAPNPTKPRLVLTTKVQNQTININQALISLFGKKQPAVASSRLFNRPSTLNPHHLPLLVYHTPLLMPALPSVDDLLHVTIMSDINQHGQFVVQQDQCEPDLLHLEEHMQRFYSNRFKEGDSQRLAKGDFVAARNLRRNLTWCRALVLRVSREGHMMVRFTDWGNADIVPLVDIQPLPRQFRNLPCLAMYCKIAGVRVQDRTLITDQQFLGQVVKIEDSLEEFQLKLELNLYEGREEFLARRKLQDKLVEEGKAVTIETIKDYEFKGEVVAA